MSELSKLLGYVHVFNALVIWAAFSCLCGVWGQWAARRWVSPAARWYEWGIGSALIGAFVYPFLESWTDSALISWLLVAIVFLEAWLLFRKRTATEENSNSAND